MFSHNDTQENNFLSNAEKTVILDFEYSQQNFLGADLASYINECAIDYSAKNEFGYSIEYNDFLDFSQENGPIDELIQIYLKNCPN